MNPSVYLVFTTCANQIEAESLGRDLVEEKLAACATVLPKATSLYTWKGKLERVEECVVLLKTFAGALGPLENRLKELHSYDCPEFLAVPAAHVSRQYAAWVEESVSPGEPSV